MKLQIFAVLLVIAGCYASPGHNVEPSNVRNSVELRIRLFVEQVILIMKSAGLDPLEVESREIDFNLESLDIVVKALVDNVRFVGASNIRINNLEYSYLFNRLRLDISLPEVRLSVGDSAVEVIVSGEEVEGQLKGSLSVKSIRLAGEGYVNVNIIGGISLRSVSINFSIGGVESDLTVVAAGSDYSEVVNNYLENDIPEYLESIKDDINERLEAIVTRILNSIWSF